MGPSAKPIAAAFVALIALSGCTGSARPAAAVAAETDDAAPGTSVEGFVLADDATPVTDAMLLLRPGDHAATSAADGKYAFADVAAGRYVLIATKLGYLDSNADVFVPDGVPVVLNVTLVQIATESPYARTLGPYAGYFQCRWSFPAANAECGVVRDCVAGHCADTAPVGDALWSQDQNAMRFQLEDASWSTIAFEARWTPGVAATSPRMALFLTYDGHPENHLYTRSEAHPSPLRHVYENAPNQGGVFPPDSPRLPDPSQTLLAWMTVHTDGSFGGPEQSTIAVAYEVRFEMWATIFYREPAPEDFTALPA